MAAVVKSREAVTASFTSTTGLQTQTVNLTKSQDETQCSPMGVTLRFTSVASDSRANQGVAVELIDNAGTPAVRFSRRGNGTYGAITVECEIVEWGSNVTVQQVGFTSLSGTSATATITSITTTRSFIIPTARASADAGGDDFNDMFIRASFNSGTQIQFDRGAAGTPDWDVYAYVITSDNGDFETEYANYSGTSTATSATHTLSNTVTLDNAFIITTYQSGHTTDDLGDAIVSTYLSSTTQLTTVRDHGASVDGTFEMGVWVVRGSASEFATQRFALDCGSALINNQTITAVDDDKAVVINSHDMAFGVWAVDSTGTGSNVEQRQSALWRTSTTNVRAQRREDASLNGSNNFIRFEVVEFELESAGPAPQTIPVGLASETDSAFAVSPAAGAVSVTVDLASETDTALTVTPEIGGAPQTVPVGLASETDSAEPVAAVPGAVLVAVDLASESDEAFPVDGVPGAVAVDVGIASEIDLAAPVFPVVEGGPQTVLIVNAAEIDQAFTVTPSLPSEEKPGAAPPTRKGKRKHRRYILPDGRSFTDPDRALFELRKILAESTKAEESGAPLANLEAEPASQSQKVGASDAVPEGSVSPGLMDEVVSELPAMIEARGPDAAPLDPELVALLLQRIDDEEAAMLLL